MLGKKIWVSGLNPQAYHPAARFFHESKEFRVEVFGSGCTVKAHSQRAINDHLSKFHNTVAVKGKLVVIEIDVGNTEPVFEVLKVAVEVFC